MEGARHHIVQLLRERPRTVRELAEVLQMTPGAVRFHLSALSHESWIRRSGLRPTARRPAHVYELNPERAQSFHRGHAPVLDELVGLLSRRLGRRRTSHVLGQAGAEIAASAAVRGTLDDRARGAVSVLEGLGALVDVEERSDTLVLRGADCPLGSSPLHHPELCEAIRALIEGIVERPVEEHCERVERARCAFEIDKPQAEDGAVARRRRR